MNEILQTVAAAITAGFAGFAAIQFFYQRRAWAQEREEWRHEQLIGRKARAIELINDFVSNSNRRAWAVKQLFEYLDHGTLQAIDRGDPVSIDRKHESLVRAALPQEIDAPTPAKGARKVKLNQEQSFALRWEALNFLNAVEVVLRAWQDHTADSDTIEAEMMFLHDSASGRYTLYEYRKSNGLIDDYPAIAAFEKKFPPKEHNQQEDSLAQPKA